MAVGVEYTAQRPSVEYFMGIAAGRGIKLYVTPASDLMKTRFIYAYEDEQQDAFTQKIKNMLQHMQERQNAIANQRQALHDQFNQYAGAQGATMEIMKIWSNLKDKGIVT